ncbi:MAG: ABC transporter substrate-binding protein, partial [Candidatus Bipolaricaulota bacterium]
MARRAWRFLMLSVVVASLFAAAVLGEPLRVCLDFFPNPNHVPLYAALGEGLLARQGIDVDIVVPSNPSDPVKLAAVRTLDIALTPQINYLIARDEGLPLIAIGALIGGALGGLLSVEPERIARLEDLAGGRIGYSLAPLEPVLWRTMLACSGVDPGSVELIHVGFNTMASLLAGTVDAIGAFRNYEPIQAELFGRIPLFFPQEAYCIPETYDILIVAHPALLEERSLELHAFLSALAAAVEMTRADPEHAFALFLQAHPELDVELSLRYFEATLPLFAKGLRHDD